MLRSKARRAKSRELFFHRKICKYLSILLVVRQYGFIDNSSYLFVNILIFWRVPLLIVKCHIYMLSIHRYIAVWFIMMHFFRWKCLVCTYIHIMVCFDIFVIDSWLIETMVGIDQRLLFECFFLKLAALVSKVFKSFTNF